MQTVKIRVATYNLYLGADLGLLFDATSLDDLAARVEVVRSQLERTDFTERAAAVAGILHREQVDVVGLQEVSRWTTTPVDDPSGDTEVLVDFLPTLTAALEAAGTPYDVHAAEVSFEGGLPVAGRWMQVSGANAVLVRRDGPVRVVEEHTGVFDTSLCLTAGIEGVAFPVRRSWGLVRVEVAGRPLVVANTHTEAWDSRVRDAQRDELLAVLDAAGCPVVLLGDLNAEPAVVGLPGDYADAWLAAGGDPGGGQTCGQSGDLGNPEPDLRSRIDYVFVRGAQVTSCRVRGGETEDRTPGGLWPSDHAAVVADLEL
jgi:endonuclease/exonuclease/phosphatase family metal-dependent hydrolase